MRQSGLRSSPTCSEPRADPASVVSSLEKWPRASVPPMGKVDGAELARDRGLAQTQTRGPGRPHRSGLSPMLGLLLEAFVPEGPVLLGLDDSIERRRGKRIRAKRIYRDPVRPSR